MAARNEVAASQNMPLMSPPKRTRLNIFGSSDTSALKAASWHAGRPGTQFSLSDEDLYPLVRGGFGTCTTGIRGQLSRFILLR